MGNSSDRSQHPVDPAGTVPDGDPRSAIAQAHAITDDAPAMIWGTGPDGRLIYISRGWYEFTGQTEADAFGRDGFGWLDAVHPEDQAESARVFSAANARRESFSLDYRLRRSDARYRWAVDAGRPRYDAAGSFLGYAGCVTDVHDRKVAETAARLSEERYRTLYDRMDQGFCIVEVLLGDEGRPADYRILEANPAFGRHTGLSGAAGRLVKGDLVPTVEPFWIETYGRVALTGEPAVFEHESLSFDGAWFEVHAFRVGEAAERRVAIFFKNIGERKRTERALARSNATFETLVERCPFGIYIVDADFRVAHMNGNSQRGAFANVRPVIGRDFSEAMRVLWPEPVAQEILSRFRRTLDTGEPFHSNDFYRPRADIEGEEGYEWELHWLTMADGRPGVICYYYDSTQLRRAEQDLRGSEARYRAVVESQSEMVCRFRMDGTILFVNGAYAASLGTSVDALVGSDFWPNVKAEDRPHARAMLESLTPERPEARIENRFEASDGPRWSLWTNRALVFDERGRPVEVQSAGIDITDRKRAEEALGEAKRAAESAKEAAEAANAAKDRFLAVLSHELRTPLTPVLMGVSVIEAEAGLSESVREHLAMIRRNVQVEVKLIDDLLDLNRVASGKLRLKFEPLDVAAVVHDACETIQPLLHERGLRLRCELPQGRCIVSADAGRLRQVLWNLLTNASKFTPAGGEVTVAAAETGGRVKIAVRDTGIGIAADVLPKVFDAFEQGDARVTRQFGGLGLGLAISKALVEQHGGTIEAHSAGPGAGTTMTLSLPAMNDAGDADGEPVDGGDGQRAAPGGQPVIRLLLVEDHADTAAMLKTLMEMSGGFRVRHAATAAEALAMAVAEPFDVVVSDIGLPDASGYDLMKRLRNAHVDLCGVAMSGYGMDEDVRRSREAGFAEHLVKPVDADVLIGTVRRVVSSATSDRRV